MNDDLTGFVVAALVASSVGFLGKVAARAENGTTSTFFDIPPAVYTNGDIEVYDPGVDSTINFGGQTFKNKSACRTWAHKLGIPVPQVCR